MRRAGGRFCSKRPYTSTGREVKVMLYIVSDRLSYTL